MGGRGTKSATGKARTSTKSNSMGASVADWYKKTYPTDDLGNEISGSITFTKALNNLADYYEMFPADSLIRERVFTELSKRTGKEYGKIYDEWLKGVS